MTDKPFPTPPAPSAVVLAKHMVHLLENERHDFAYSHFRDNLHVTTATAVLGELKKAASADAAPGTAMGYFAASEVGSSIVVNSLSSLVVLISMSDEVAAAVDDIDLFRRSLTDHLCEGLCSSMARLANERVLDIVQDRAARVAAAASADKQ